MQFGPLAPMQSQNKIKLPNACNKTFFLNKQTNNGLQQIIFKQTNKCKYVQQTNNKPTHSKNHMKCWTTTMSVLIPLKLELDPTYQSQESERESLQMFLFSLKPEKGDIRQRHPG